MGIKNIFKENAVSMGVSKAALISNKFKVNAKDILGQTAPAPKKQEKPQPKLTPKPPAKKI